MNYPSVHQEIHPGQRIPHEEIVRQHVALQTVTGSAGGNEVAVGGDAAPRARVHVIDGGMIVLEPGAAVHTAPAAVAHHRALERSLEIDVAKVGMTTPAEKPARRTGEADAMNAVPRHCTSPKRTTPRAGWGTRAGRVVVGGAHQRVTTTVGRRCGGSVEGRRSTLMCLQSLIGSGAHWAGGAARRTNVERNVGAQERAASAHHIFDGGTPKKVTGRPPGDRPPARGLGLAKRQ